MKKLFFALLFIFAVSALFAQTNKIELSFNYTSQKGFSSNQFAVWIEDAQSRHIKTLYATKFTATGGWKKRELSLPLWVKQSALAEMNKAQIDAITKATPKAGKLTYTWDGTDSAGKQLPEGEYKVCLEATLRSENRVLYTAAVKLGEKYPADTANSVVVQGEYFGSGTAERGMISQVTIRY